MPKQTNSKTQNKTQNPDLELAFQGINKKFGDGALMRLGDAKNECIRYLTVHWQLICPWVLADCQEAELLKSTVQNHLEKQPFA